MQVRLQLSQPLCKKKTGERFNIINPTGLLMYYPFDADSVTNNGVVVKNYASGRGTYYNYGTITSPNVISTANYINGSGSLYATTGDPPFNILNFVLTSYNLTICFWMFKPVGLGNNNYLFTLNNNQIYLTMNNSNQLNYAPNMGFNYAPNLYNQWYHVALVFVNSSTYAMVYVNGQPYSNYGISTTQFTINSSINAYLGSYQSAGYITSGYYDDFRMYGRSLAASEIYALYSSSDALAKINTVSAVSTNISGNIYVGTNSVSLSLYGGSYNQAQISRNGNVISFGATGIFTDSFLLENTTYNYTIVPYFNNITVSGSPINLSVKTNSVNNFYAIINPMNLLLYFPFNVGDNYSTNYIYNYASGIPSTYGQMYYNSANCDISANAYVIGNSSFTHFRGDQDSYMNTLPITFTSNNTTVSMWIYWTGGYAATYCMTWSITNVIWFGIQNSMFSVYGTNTNYPVAQNTWYHVVHTYSYYLSRTYVNGVLIFSYNGGFNFNGSSVTMYVGCYWGGGWGFYGYINDLRLYNREISESEVKSLYNYKYRQFTALIGNVYVSTSNVNSIQMFIPGQTVDTVSIIRNGNTIANGNYVSYTDTGLSNNTTYNYKFIPYNSYGVSGPISTTFSFSTTTVIPGYNVIDTQNLQLYLPFEPGSYDQNTGSGSYNQVGFYSCNLGYKNSFNLSSNYGYFVSSGSYISNNNYKVGTSALFTDACGNYGIYMPTSYTLLSPPNFTISFWSFIIAQNPQYGNQSFFFGMQGQLWIGVNSNMYVFSNYFTTTYQMPLNTWVYFTFISNWSASIFTMYANGNSIYSAASQLFYTGFPTNLYIGSNWGGGYGLYGYFDDFRLYYRAITASEIVALYNYPSNNITVTAYTANNTTNSINIYFYGNYSRISIMRNNKIITSDAYSPFIDTNLQPNKKYFYLLTSYDANGIAGTTAITSGTTSAYAIAIGLGSPTQPFQTQSNPSNVTGFAVANLYPDSGIYYRKQVTQSYGYVCVLCTNGYLYTMTATSSTPFVDKFTTYSISWGGCSVIEYTLRQYTGISMTTDGTKMAVCSIGYCYYSFYNGQFTTPTQTQDSISRNYSGICITGDGKRIIVCETNGYIYFAEWMQNGTTSINFQKFTRTNETVARNYTGITCSPDGTKIAYCVNPGYVYYSVWNGTNYSIGKQTNNYIAYNCTGIQFTPDTRNIMIAAYYTNENTTTYTQYALYNTHILSASYNDKTDTYDGFITYLGEYVKSIIDYKRAAFCISTDGIYAFLAPYENTRTWYYQMQITYGNNYISYIPNLTYYQTIGFTGNTVTLDFSGTYSYVTITRNGTLVSPNPTYGPITDTGLTGNTTYSYIITPYDVYDISGTPSSAIVQSTLPNIASLTSYQTTNYITLYFPGSYAYVTIVRNDVIINTYYTSLQYDDTGLPQDTNYTYIVTPFSAIGNPGTAQTIRTSTLPVLYSLSVLTLSGTLLSIDYPGDYNYVTIAKNGILVSPNPMTTPYTFSGLNYNTFYAFKVIPYSLNNVPGNSLTINTYTLSSLNTYSISTIGTTFVYISFSGIFYYITILQNGSTLPRQIITSPYTGITNLSPNTNYSYVIKSYNQNSVLGQISTTMNIVTLPTLNTATFGTITTSSIQINITGVYTYVKWVKTISGVAGSANQLANGITTFTDTGLGSDTVLYTYTLTPYNSIDVAGSPITISTHTLPTIVSSYVGTVSAYSVQLFFPGTYSYVMIYRNGSLITPNPTTSPYMDVGATPNRITAYVITPYNEENTSGNSVQLMTTTLGTVAGSYIQTLHTLIVSYPGLFSYVTLSLNGVYTVPNPTTTDPVTFGNLLANTGYSVVVTPYNVATPSVSGTPYIVTAYTLPTINYATITKVDISSVSMVYDGSFDHVSITQYSPAPRVWVQTSTVPSYSTTVKDDVVFLDSTLKFVISPDNIQLNTTYYMATNNNSNGIYSMINGPGPYRNWYYNGPYTTTNTEYHLQGQAVTIQNTSYIYWVSLPIIFTSSKSSYNIFIYPTGGGGGSPDTSLYVNIKLYYGINNLINGNVSLRSFIDKNTVNVISNYPGVSPNESYGYTITPFNTSNAYNTSISTPIVYTLPIVYTTRFITITYNSILINITGAFYFVTIATNGNSNPLQMPNNTIIYTDTNLLANSLYFYKILPYNIANPSVSGDYFYSAAIYTYSVIYNYVFTPTYYSIQIDISGVFNYLTISRNGIKNPVTLQPGVATYTDMNVTANTGYYYVITSYNNNAVPTVVTTSIIFTLPYISTITLTNTTTSSTVMNIQGNYNTLQVGRSDGYIVTISGDTLFNLILFKNKCVLWLDATNSDNYTLSSGVNLSTLIDKSPLGNYTSVNSGTPQLILNAVNGNSVFCTNTGVTGGSFIASLATITSCSFFTVLIFNAWNSYRIFTLGMSNGGPDTNYSTYIVMRTNTNGTFYLYNNGTTLYTSSVLQLNTPYIISFFIKDGGQFVIGVNGVYTTTTMTNALYVFTIGIGSGLGTDGVGNGGFISFGELIVFNDTSTISEYQTIEGYLAWKWGLQSNLPYNHPYYNAFSYAITNAQSSGTTYIDNTLLPDSTYSYTVLPYNLPPLGVSGASYYNSVSISGTYYYTNSIYTLPIITAFTITSYDSSSVILSWDGSYNTALIQRNNTSIQTITNGLINSNRTYTDFGVNSNTSYNYTITPYNINNPANSGSVRAVNTVTLGNLYSYSYSITTLNAITVNISGIYNYITVSRNGGAALTLSGGVSSYTDTGLLSDASYSYTFVPYNTASIPVAGPSFKTNPIFTLPNLTSYMVGIVTTSAITLSFDGSYSSVTITDNGNVVASNVNIKTFLDNSGGVGYLPDTIHNFQITPYNPDNATGPVVNFTAYTLPTINYINYTSSSNSTILIFDGSYSYVNIYRGNTILSPNTVTNVISPYYDNSGGAGLTANSAYIYKIIPYTPTNISGQYLNVTAYTRPAIYSVSYGVVTPTSIRLLFNGGYDYVKITQTNMVNYEENNFYNISGTSYVDNSMNGNLIANNPYSYIITPYSVALGNVAGVASNSITIYSGAILNNYNVGIFTANSVQLVFNGTYQYVNIARNGTTIATNYTNNQYTDNSGGSGLLPDTSYNYVITPYNGNSIVGTSSYIIPACTLPTVTKFIVDNSNVTVNTIPIYFDGCYNYMTISKGGINISGNVRTSPYIINTIDLSANGKYPITITPYNLFSVSGTTANILYGYTKPAIYTCTTSNIAANSVTLDLKQAKFDHVSIYSNGNSIADNVTGNTYVDMSVVPDVCYNYVIIPYNVVGVSGDPFALSPITTLPNIIVNYVATINTLTFSLSGTFEYVNIMKGNTTLQTNYTNTTFIDSDNANTANNYTIIPYNIINVSGIPFISTVYTLPTVTIANITTITTSSIQFQLDGSYNYIRLNGSDNSGNSHIIDVSFQNHSYMDNSGGSGLLANQLYTYSATPYNAVNAYGQALTVSGYTLPTLTNISYVSNNTNAITLNYDGSFAYANVYNADNLIGTNISSRNYIDTSGTANSLYNYKVIPYNPVGVSGNYLTISGYTLPSISNFIIKQVDYNNVVLQIDGSFNSLNILRNGNMITPSISGDLYTDSAGILPNVSYNYTVTPYNPVSQPGATTSTLEAITFSKINSVSYSSTAYNVTINVSGTYSYFNVRKNTSEITNHIYDISYTDTAVMPNVTYNYNIIPYSYNNSSNSSVAITVKTKPVINNIIYVPTINSIQFNILGAFNSVTISRNGTDIVTNLHDISYTDMNGLIDDTNYNYVFTPYTSEGVAGITYAITVGTLARLFSVKYMSDISSVNLTVSGDYSYIDIFRDSNLIYEKLYDTSYNDTNYGFRLAINTNYNYSVVPYNSLDMSGASITITAQTLPTLYDINYYATTSIISLTISGTYSYVNILRNGVPVRMRLNDISYTDTLISTDVSYQYTIIPYGPSDISGSFKSIITESLPAVYEIKISTYDDHSVTLDISGYYNYVNIYRNDVLITNSYTNYIYIDNGPLLSDTSYNYYVIPFNHYDISGTQSNTITVTTLPIIYVVNYSADINSVTLSISGMYAYVDISNVTNNYNIGAQLTDSGLTYNSLYEYIITPYNFNDISGTSYTIMTETLPEIFNLRVISYDVSYATIMFDNSSTSLLPSYDHVSIYRNGSQIVANINDISFTDYDLYPDTSYDYIVVPYNSCNISGSSSYPANVITLPFIYNTSYIADNSFIILNISGGFSYLDIARDDPTNFIVTNLYDISYTDASGIDGLMPHSSYNYYITGFNQQGIPTANPSYMSVMTLATITYLAYTVDDMNSLINITFDGSYAHAILDLNGNTLATV